MTSLVPDRDPVEQPGDICDRLREDHQWFLAELDALRSETDNHRRSNHVARLRQAWMVHALAEETVVYRALEGVARAGSPHRADERFSEHELVGTLFENLRRNGAVYEWRDRVDALRETIARHVSASAGVSMRLRGRFGDGELVELGRRFDLASAKLAVLERAKAA